MKMFICRILTTFCMNMRSVKNVRMLLVVLFCVVPFCSCSDDHDEPPAPQFSAEFLKQTAWQGELIHFSGQTGEVFRRYKVGVLFATDTQGELDYLTTIGSGDAVEDYEETEGFTYTVDEKLLTIKSSLISGWWLLEELTKDGIVLINGPQQQLDAQGKLVLNRVY